ncbi:sugar transferase [Salmonirosea aquatica]|uniref:Sugar transferase n=1 Tax=Salmonirosea aquatica TaxID=2654236 RepID=A0A7C9BMF7_9BACT|nr:sugar transferase [Cytophagaceae bacterium SJW1-29]
MEIQSTNELEPGHEPFNNAAPPIRGWHESGGSSEAEMRGRIAFLYDNFQQYLTFSNYFAQYFSIESFSSRETLLEALRMGYPADAIVASAENGGWELLETLRSGSKMTHIPLILLTKRLAPQVIHRARVMKADDIFDENFSGDDLLQRLNFLFKRKWYEASKAAQRVQPLQVKTPLWKRTFDVVVVGGALLVLSPIFLLVALLIRLDSRGPVFYKSKRVGSGFRIFNLYKFRTMRTNADKLVKDMASLNIYNQAEKSPELTPTLCESCTQQGLKTCERPLFWDGKEVCELTYLREKEQKAAFMKFQNDPRITGVGHFLRNTSLDELPQLVNIIKGDMSLVGNRPLPIYEAEKLTTDDKIMRFAGPAGLTGYWQVMKRSKKKAEISQDERIELDIYYVKNLSFWLDMKIILKTFPALIQSESV